MHENNLPGGHDQLLVEANIDIVINTRLIV